MIRNITVVGGENGIDVESARRVELDDVRVLGATLDGIHVRFSQVMIRDCSVALTGPYAQGIDISYSGCQGMSAVEGCDVSGGSEGIVTHSSNVMVSGNRVHGTSLRGITMIEMSMGEVADNNVSGSASASGSTAATTRCARSSRTSSPGRRSDRSGDRARVGVGIEANYYALAHLDDNVLVGNPRPTAAFFNSRFEPSG